MLVLKARAALVAISSQVTNYGHGFATKENRFTDLIPKISEEWRRYGCTSRLNKRTTVILGVKAFVGWASFSEQPGR